MPYVRSPIVVVLGHVDVGKTTLLDKIRGTAVTLREPGTMTQHIGASFLPWKTLSRICGPLLKMVRGEIEIPGFLVIDTPGHEAFVNLRKRGGSIADIAILVVDIREGFEAQTYESIEILKARKIPFILVANKIDKIPGWNSKSYTPFIINFKNQNEDVQIRLEELIYRLIEEMNKLGFNCDRYDRVRDFSTTIAIIPISALTGEGIPDLLMVLAGLTQKFLLKSLIVERGPAKGVVLEVKEEIGLGTTVDTIIYEGTIRKGDTIVVGGIEKPIVTKVRAILMPKPLDEIRSPEDRFLQLEEVHAACGIKIVASDLEGAIAGAPVRVVWSHDELEDTINEVAQEVSSIKLSREVNGVIVKADTLGTLEALVDYLERKGIPVRYADIGNVVKRDVIEAQLVKKEDKYRAVILAFNVKVTEEAKIEAKYANIPILQSNIIYRLVEEYQNWYHKTRELDAKIQLSKLILPAKIKILPGYVFRRSNPAIVGIKVISGRLRPGYPLFRAKDGKVIGRIMQIQAHGENVGEAVVGQEVAVSIRGNVIVGRHIKEGDILYSDVPFDHMEKMRSLVDFLTEDEIKLLEEIERIKLSKLRSHKE